MFASSFCVVGRLIRDFLIFIPSVSETPFCAVRFVKTSSEHLLHNYVAYWTALLYMIVTIFGVGPVGQIGFDDYLQIDLAGILRQTSLNSHLTIPGNPRFTSSYPSF